MRHITLAALAAMLFVSTAFAQRFEVYGDYSYLQFNPTIQGTNSRAFNGGGGGFQANIGNYFGIKGDFQGYGSTTVTINVTSPIPTPDGIIPIGTYSSRANMFTYLFGPAVQARAKKLRLFGEVLFGGSHTSGYVNLYNQAIVGGMAAHNPDQHPFSMAVGGGVDVNLTPHIALRLGEFDWLLTRYTNVFTSTNNQNSFRYLGGVVFQFGSR